MGNLDAAVSACVCACECVRVCDRVRTYVCFVSV